MGKLRLDVFLTENGYFSSREKARTAIMEGKVFIDNEREDKPGAMIKEDASVEIRGEPLPFVSRGGLKLKKAVEQLERSDADTLIPVVAFSYPPQRAMIVEEGRLVFEYPRYLDSRSQDLVPHYHDVGQFYVFRTGAFKRNQKLMVGNILPLVVSELEVQDIDNESDWAIAEMKYRLMVSGGEK